MARRRFRFFSLSKHLGWGMVFQADGGTEKSTRHNSEMMQVPHKQYKFTAKRSHVITTIVYNNPKPRMIRPDTAH